jgi:hypothetical protein
MSAVSLVAYQMNASSSELGAQRQAIQRSMAAYDLANDARQNSTVNGCVSDVYSGNSVCVNEISASYRSAFGIGGIIFSAQKINGTSVCFPLLLESLNITRNVCISVE